MVPLHSSSKTTHGTFKCPSHTKTVCPQGPSNPSTLILSAHKSSVQTPNLIPILNHSLSPSISRPSIPVTSATPSPHLPGTLKTGLSQLCSSNIFLNLTLMRQKLSMPAQTSDISPQANSQHKCLVSTSHQTNSLPPIQAQRASRRLIRTHQNLTRITRTLKAQAGFLEARSQVSWLVSWAESL